MNKKLLFKFFGILAVIYIILLLLTSYLNDNFILRRTELLLLPSAALACGSILYQNKIYNYLNVVFFIIFISLAILKIKILNIPAANIEIIKYLTFSVGASTIFIFFTSLLKKLMLVRFICLLVFISPVIIIWGYYFSASAWLNTDAVLAIMQTNFTEAKEYLSDYLSIKFYAVFLIFIFVLYLLNKKAGKLSLKNKGKNFYILLAVAIIFSIFSVYKGKGNLLTYIFKDTYIYLQRYDDFNKYKEERKQNINKNIGIRDSSDGIYVLVIGESQNKNYMSAYGYKRPTTPWLESIKNNPDVVFFSNAHSCHTHTVPVLTYALTAKNQYNDIDLAKAISVIEVAEAAGFETVWLSNQVRYGLWDTPITVIASEANQQEWINKNAGEVTRTDYYDLKLVDSLDDIKYTEKMLIVIHLMGNHGSYSERYPVEFEKFSGDKDVDDYDNSILYNDYVVENLYKKLSKLQNFKCMIYFADHADAPRQHLGHDASRYIPEMTDIPFYMCFSESYMQENQDKIARLKIAQDKYFTNDLIFNMILSLMDIKIEGIYEPKNDIASPQYDFNPERFRTLYGKKRIGEK